MNMAKYILRVFDGRYAGKVVGVSRDITSARKMVYKLLKDFKEYTDIAILDASGESDVRNMRIVASVYPADFRGLIAYHSHTTGKVGKLTPNGAVVSFAWDEKDHIYHD